MALANVHLASWALAAQPVPRISLETSVGNCAWTPKIAVGTDIADSMGSVSAMRATPARRAMCVPFMQAQTRAKPHALGTMDAQGMDGVMVTAVVPSASADLLVPTVPGANIL